MSFRIVISVAILPLVQALAALVVRAVAKLLQIYPSLVALICWRDWIRWLETWTGHLAGNRLVTIGREIAEALESAQVIIGKLTYGRANARVDVLAGNIEEVALEEDVFERDIATKVGNTRTRVIRNCWWKKIQGEILVVLANEDTRAFR
jgi:hypothetical protein